MVIWRAAFDILPIEEPPGNGWAKWKVERAGEWWICERQADADEHTASLPVIVDAESVITLLAPLVRFAQRAEDEKTRKALDMIIASLDAADEGFKAFERELAQAKGG